MKRLSLQPVGETVDVRTEARLLDALLAKRVNVLMACGGHGLCATCHVRVRAGADQLSPRTERERRTLEFVSGTDATSRLACQARVRGDGVVIELPKGLFIEKAEDLLSLLGTRAPEDVLHPIKGRVLIAKGKIITRSQLEELRSLSVEVHQLRNPGKAAPPPASAAETATAGKTIALPERKPAASAMAPPATPAPPLVAVSPAAPARGLEVGAVLGKCLLVEAIGQGGSGKVFRAIHRTLNIPVAVKVLHIGADEVDLLGKLRSEAQLLAQLNHPSIVRVWDFEEEGPQPYLVLEHVEGLSLAELIDQSGRLLPDRAISVVLQVTEALAAAWKLGIVHRDVKPGNILLARDGTAKLADLGLAMMFGHRPADPAADSEPPEGTVAYMSPEQARASSRVDHRADIYSLGVTFYHAVTGRLPFRGRSRMEVMLMHARDNPVPPHAVVGGLSAAASDVILRMMAKAPDDRYQTYDALRADLLHLLDQAEAALDENPTAEPTSAGLSTSGPAAGTSLWKALLSSFSRKKSAGGPNVP